VHPPALDTYVAGTKSAKSGVEPDLVEQRRRVPYYFPLVLEAVTTVGVPYCSPTSI
jgi:hypothetical protein